MTFGGEHGDESAVGTAERPDPSPSSPTTGSLEVHAEENQQEPTEVEDTNEETPSLAKLVITGVGLWFAVFLVSLDQTIVANAIPKITDDFHKLTDVGWYGSGYLLTSSAFQLFYGRVYANFSIKYTFLVAISIFELGSLVCGVAPTSAALIVGRAVAGFGGAGIMSGAVIIIAHSVPLRIRPMFIGALGAVFAIASVLGPVLGGIFTTKLTWRWCFYINLPFGAVTILAVLIFVKDPDRSELQSISLTEKLKRIDLIGLFIFIPAVVCLLLALQWGGSTYPWNDGRIIALFVLSGVIGIAFLVFEHWQGKQATLPLHLLAQRSVAAATWNCFCNGAAFLTFVYYIPFWHQVVRNASAFDSGLRLLPLILGIIITAMLSGTLVSKFGYYAPMMILASVLAPIGEGLLTTFTVNTTFSQWVGYEALTGLGLGLGQQMPLLAVQTVLSKADVPSGTSIVMLMQTLGGAIFVTVGQSVLQNELQKNLLAALPSGSFDPSHLIKAGATAVWSLVPPEYLHVVLVAYNSALTKVYTVGLCMTALTVIGSLSIEWKSVKKAREKDSVKGDTEAEKEPT